MLGLGPVAHQSKALGRAHQFKGRPHSRLLATKKPQERCEVKSSIYAGRMRKPGKSHQEPAGC